MKKFIFGVVFLMSLALFAGEALSQPFDDVKGPPSKEKREMIRKRMETLKMWRLTKILDLDEKRAARFFPLINEYDRKREAMAIKMERDMRKLRKVIDTANERELKAIIEGIEDNHRKFQEIDREKMEKLKSMLTVRETAKLIIFKQDFDREMKKIIMEVRKKHSRKQRNRPKNPPAE